MFDDEKRQYDIYRETPYDIGTKMHEFSELLNSIESTDDKKRRLWKEIYQNAIIDRQNAAIIFAKLFDICDNKSTEHAVHGKTITSCIERMSRANEQLLKLADLIARSTTKEETIDINSVYDQIGSH